RVGCSGKGLGPAQRQAAQEAAVEQGQVQRLLAAADVGVVVAQLTGADRLGGDEAEHTAERVHTADGQGRPGAPARQQGLAAAQQGEPHQLGGRFGPAGGQQRI
ncbi:hypothetical protein RZS08_60265, partial [Arthrospira platensis SPKY1]|nr:hypothetical protein [Arthrospira platensis SPKY1]